MTGVTRLEHAAPDGVEVFDDPHEPGHGTDEFGGHATHVMIVGLHPVPHLSRFTTYEHEERAIGTDHQQRQFAGLAAGLERATTQRRTVPTDDRADFGLRQTQLFPRLHQGRGEDPGGAEACSVGHGMAGQVGRIAIHTHILD